MRKRKINAAVILGAAGLFMALTACGGGTGDRVESLTGAQTSTPEDTAVAEATAVAANLKTAAPTLAGSTASPTASASVQLDSTLMTVATPVTVELAAPLVIAEGQADADGDGKAETVRIWFTAGKEVTDTEPGPFEGTFRHGHFDAVLTGAEGKELGRISLSNAFGQDISFRKQPVLPLPFDDYNGDGQPDFAVGQWSGSNGSMYAIFTVERDGFKLIERDIYSADSRPFIRYRKVGDASFLNIYYDMEKGQYMQVRRDWEKGSFTRRPAEVATVVGSAGLD
ncbi:hypothetical protein [Gorillibacterium massiliense]|uniref:hypothetical protein n=1 Tax=Gorillibacterium massiliense TaxID=1280390 RepID=UPI00069413BC|nr:hypothetical protein [Gorillibacterium massiliense]